MTKAKKTKQGDKAVANLRVIHEGKYTICVAPPALRERLREQAAEYGAEDKAMVLFKGEVILGLLVFHPCGEWTFLTSEKTPALRLESLLFIVRVTAQADELWKQATAEDEAEMVEPKQKAKA